MDQIDLIQRDLEQRVEALRSVIVAFSGGVDSSLVAAIAGRTLGSQALAVTAISPALASGELAPARHVARSVGIRHETVATHEMRRPGYRANAPDRCYHCKSELYETLARMASARGYAAVLSGANADDAGDWRPGLKAAAQQGVLHPLLERGVTKRQVRELAGRLKVPSAGKVASPCLASRIPYGTPVTKARLSQVDAAERGIRALGFTEFRVRHHGQLGKLEMAEEDLPRALSGTGRAAIADAIRAAGFQRAAIDLEPFHSGVLNLGIFAPAPDRER